MKLQIKRNKTMGVKMKIFKMGTGNSEEISNFMESVHVVQNGVLLTEENIGILYKDKTEIGLGIKEILMAAGGELAKVQNQFTIQEGLVRAYNSMITKFQADVDYSKDCSEMAEERLTAHMATFDQALCDTVTVVQNELKQQEQAYKTTPKTNKNKRELILKDIYDLSNKLKEVEPMYTTYKAEFDAGTAALQKEIGKHNIDAANMEGKVKEYIAFRDDAVAARDHAYTFMQTTKAYIQDLKDGKVTELL